ncbi:MAG: tRNA (adenosine(37)-N6)-threonylcarbamoyltransferase complex dimerization subunit type 1 TsaB [Phycisphaeraceae bacterium]
MAPSQYNLAIETTSRQGTLALGRGEALLEVIDLPVQRRHNVGLVPGIDRLCRAHGVTPTGLDEVYISLGPGSFTGLRVAVAAVKMLALARGVKVVGVPTLEVVARQADPAHEHVAVCLNLKRDEVYCGVYRRQGEDVHPVTRPALRTVAALLCEAPRPVALLGEMLPELPADMDEQVTVLPPEAARPRAENVWHVGRALAQRGAYSDPFTLEPMYVRRPEAVELWERRVSDRSAAAS